MSRADDIRARARQLQRAESERTQRPKPSTPVPATRSKAVRRTLDLPPTMHAQLTQWCGETAVQLGVARVTGQDTLAALVRRLLSDPELAQQLRADLAEELAQR
jgi:hypothetical protein